MPTLFSTLPLLAGIGFVAFILWRSFAPNRSVGGGDWIAPALLSFAFLLWSIYAVTTGGSMGFWTEHVRNAWGNQIWFDLLLAGGVAFALMAPRLRSVGMAPLPWGLLIIATGSVGVLATYARYLYLEARRSR